jgi:predicted component of type VI protein secretion system
MPDIATHEEVLKILTEQARAGSITAAAALERALRAVEQRDREQREALDDELNRLLGK